MQIDREKLELLQWYVKEIGRELSNKVVINRTCFRACI